MTWRTQLNISTLCIFFTSASFTMCVPFLPVYLLELGAAEDHIEFWSALTFAVTFLISGILAPVWGRISDNKSKKLMALRASIILALSYGCGGLVQTPWQLIGARIIQGFGVGYLTTTMSMVSEYSPKDKLGTSMSQIQTAQLIGTISGPLLGGTLAHAWGYRASFIIAACCLLLVTAITAFLPGNTKAQAKTKEQMLTEAQNMAPKEPGHRSGSILQDLKFCFSDRIICELLIAWFLFAAVTVALQPLMSLYVAEFIGGYDDVAFYTGVACAIPSIAGVFSSALWGYLGQKRGYYRVIIGSTLGAGLFLCSQALVPSYTLLLITQGLVGLFLVGLNPAISAAMTLATPPDFKGRAFGALMMSRQFGSMLGPFAGAAIAHRFAIANQFLVSGVLLLVLSTYFIWRYRALKRAQLSGLLTALVAPTPHDAPEPQATTASQETTTFQETSASQTTVADGQQTQTQPGPAQEQPEPTHEQPDSAAKP